MTSKSNVTLHIILYFLLGYPIFAAGLDCRGIVSPAVGNAGYQLRENGTRCEGFYDSDESRDGLTLAGLFIGTSQIPTKSVIVVSSPGITGNVSIRAIALSVTTFYRMDSILKEAGSLRWPLSEVVLPTHLNPSDLGIIGWISDAGEITYVPLKLNGGVSPGAPQSTVVHLILSSSVPLDRLLWRWSPKHVRCGQFSGWLNAVSQSLAPGKGIKVDLPSTAKGDICVEAQGQERGNAVWYPLTATLRIPH